MDLGITDNSEPTKYVEVKYDNYTNLLIKILYIN